MKLKLYNNLVNTSGSKRNWEIMNDQQIEVFPTPFIPFGEHISPTRVFKDLESSLFSGEKSKLRQSLMGMDIREAKGEIDPVARMRVYKRLMEDYSRVVKREDLLFFHRMTSRFFWQEIERSDYYLFYNKKSGELARIKLSLANDKSKGEKYTLTVETMKSEGSPEVEIKQQDLNNEGLDKLKKMGLFEFFIRETSGSPRSR